MNDIKYCGNCGSRLTQVAKYCPKCGHKVGLPIQKSQKAKTSKTISVLIFCLLIMLAIILFATAIVGYFRMRSLAAHYLNRNEIILRMINLNLEKENLDDDNDKLLKILSESGFKTNTLYQLSAIPIYIQGNPELLLKCETIDTSGCINKNGIYILQQNSPELSEYMTVVYSHEALHAIYSNLSAQEKEKLKSMLWKASVSANQKLKDELNTYGYKQSSDEWYSELFARLGTEEIQLPLELEDYYSNFFQDRKLNLPIKYGKTMSTVDSAIANCQQTRRRQDCEKAITYVNSISTTRNPILTEFQKVYGY